MTIGPAPAAGAVRTVDIKDSAITTAKIAAGAVDTSELADDAVSLAKLAGGTADKIIGFGGSGDPEEQDAPEGSVTVYEFTDNTDLQLADSTSSYTVIGTSQQVDLDGAKFLRIIVAATYESGGGSNYYLEMGVRISSSNYWQVQSDDGTPYRDTWTCTSGGSDTDYYGVTPAGVLNVQDLSVPDDDTYDVEIIGGFKSVSNHKLKGSTGGISPTRVWLKVYK